MARIRAIKPEFWSSPDIAKLSFGARLTYIALWNWADDFGRGTFNPREFLGFAFPNDESVTVSDLISFVGELRRHVGVRFYVVGERKFYDIPSWNLHQKMDKRVKRSKYPNFSQGIPWLIEEDRPLPAKTSLSENYADMSGENGVTLPLEQGNRGTGEQGINLPQKQVLGDSVTAVTSKTFAPNQANEPQPHETTPPTTQPEPQTKQQTEYPADFLEFWDNYPRKVAKRDALKAFTKAKKRAPTSEIINGAQRFASDPNRVEKFTPYPAKWLNGDRWKDEQQPAYQQQQPQNRIFGTRPEDWLAPPAPPAETPPLAPLLTVVPMKEVAQ